VRYALVHSELFLKNRLQIQVKSADLKDAHSELLPTLQLSTRFYLDKATGNSGSPVSVNMQIVNWSPYVALFKIKAGGIIVDMAQANHFLKISEGIAEMAKLFIKIDVLKCKIRAHRQMVALLRSKVDFGKSRKEQGAQDPLELKGWDVSVRGQLVQIKALEQEMEAASGQLKAIMGYHPDFYLPLDTRDAINQVLNGFNGHLVTFTDIQAGNLGLKILAKKEQLQSVRVEASYMLLLPQPVLMIESISNQVDRTSGFNMALGMDHILWDGFRRVRDVKRQKMLLREAHLDRTTKSEAVYNKYRTLQAGLDVAAETEAFNREQSKLAELNEERELLRYKSGNIPFHAYMEARIKRAETDVASLKALEERVASLIELATLAGGLNKYNARIKF